MSAHVASIQAFWLEEYLQNLVLSLYDCAKQYADLKSSEVAVF